MTNLTNQFSGQSWIYLQTISSTPDTPIDDDNDNSGPKVSPILIFFLFLILDAFIIAAFYFCYFMRTRSRKPHSDQVQDKPPPYQIAVMESGYPPVKISDEESSELPSYNDTVTRNTNLYLSQLQVRDLQIDMTVKMT